MTSYVAFLRAINVGGTGKLRMAELRAICESCGFVNVRTYIQSGNIVFGSTSTAPRAKARLERALNDQLGSAIGVAIRGAEELAAIARHNPFPDAAPNQLLVYFLDAPPPHDAADGLVIRGRERVSVDGRNVYVHYPDGIGRSKLKLPFAADGTARNLNTILKLLEMAAD